MIAGLSGTLLSHEALENALHGNDSLFVDSARAGAERTRMRAWHVAVRSRLGPASGARTILDRIAVPLFSQLGYRVLPAGGSSERFNAVLLTSNGTAAGLVVTGWGQEPGSAWRDAVRQGISLDAAWCFCLTGPSLRVVDSRRTYSRRFVQFALDEALDDDRGFHVLWSLLHADGMRRPLGQEAALERAIAVSERHRSAVREALQRGVEEALVHLLRAFASAAASGPMHRDLPALRVRTYDEALIVIYRILFLLFAEARNLVPRWHPVFRDGYTIEALRDSLEHLPRPRGLWEALQAMSRLAHGGCRLGALKVPPFNGRLFSPGHSPLADTVQLDDAVVRDALLSLTTRPVRSGRVRVSYGDLGVEQLGGIYERLLDLKPSSETRQDAPALVRAATRKVSGSFYTPRSLTEFLVRRTLAPLVAGARPERILELRVLDPAMGSGAFLVAACRYLASAYEAALVREGAFATADITERERIEFRRAIAQRCLFGVDINPMAVQLGRLSLWLATMAADRPLTFLDHRLRTGNSLVGARLEDLLRQPSAAHRLSKPAALPLFDDDQVQGAIGGAVSIRSLLALQPDDTLAGVREKERALEELERDNSALSRPKAVANLWCAGWFRPAWSRRHAAGAFGALSDMLLGRGDALPQSIAGSMLAETRAIASTYRFFHWALEYPEVFYRSDGAPLDRAGFDAVLGNPPWEMLRGDRDAVRGPDGQSEASQLTTFARTSGVYRFQGSGHANLYQLFLERALSLVREGGRLGLVLPSGFALDQGSADLRRALFDRTAVDGIVSLENREGMFPIHRSLKFLLLSATKGGCTTELKCRFGITTANVLDTMADDGPGAGVVRLPRALVERVSGPSLAVPEVRNERDLEIVSELSFRWPALGTPVEDGGWGVRFGRELNATDDRGHFLPAKTGERRMLTVVEGKHLTPFAVDLGAPFLRIRVSAAAQLLDAAGTFERPRLAYREVAAATNRLSLIAAIVPAGVVTTHTVLCLKTALDDESQQFLCGIFNSFVANYLIRPRISTHVGAGIIARLPMPRPPRTSRGFREIARLAASLARSPSPVRAAALQAEAARLYGLRSSQFAHVLETFPLVAVQEREAAMRAFWDIVT